MSIAITFAGLTMDGIKTWREQISSKVEEEEFPRRHGSIIQEIAFLGSRKIFLEGEVFKSTEALLKTYLYDLGRLLTEKGRDKLILRDDSRFLNAIKRDLSYQFNAARAAGVGAAFTIEFIAADPFWYDPTETTNTQSAVGASPFNYAITNGGSVSTPVKIEIVAAGGNVTDVKLTNSTTGLFIRYSGTILNGQTLLIETDRAGRQKATNGGSNALSLITGSFWHLIVGVNNIQYDGPTGVNILVKYTLRYP